MKRIELVVAAAFAAGAAALTSPGAAQSHSSQPAATGPVARLLDSAERQTRTTRLYDPAYRRLAYPGGDVPMERGVCADVVVRAFRAAGVDLQVLVHEDMSKAFRAYPSLWRLTKPDRNIDHRRVPNLETFFARKGRALDAPRDPRAYRAGDVVFWRLPNGLPHVGLVSDRLSAAGEGPPRPLVFHNVGEGARLEDVLFAYALTGHARWF